VASKEIGLEVNLETAKYMEISTDKMQGEVTVGRLIIIPFKGWSSSDIWERPNELKFYSGRK
jgi:hypothetical protein